MANDSAHDYKYNLMVLHNILIYVCYEYMINNFIYIYFNYDIDHLLMFVILI